MATSYPTFERTHAVTVEHPDSSVSARIRARCDAGMSIVVIETGAARVQCYATAQQCRDLAAMFGAMADSIEAAEVAA